MPATPIRQPSTSGSPAGTTPAAQHTNIPSAPATAGGFPPVGTTPPAAKIWSPPHLKVDYPQQLPPVIGKPGQG